ncbi:3'-5' exonuclease [Vibrio alfacsensis]|uniref:3'-5' exonuclease n=1 Tax=Vibrio alfacsensis TaxID=1074311 RepID=UPI002ADD45E5|nr:3'-5' exonuclease [Vibrio alfacsensis]WQE77887.1 3'-5' exonuclease [Vibrio alfacsensis]
MIFDVFSERIRNKNIDNFLQKNCCPDYLSCFLLSQMVDKNLSILELDYLFVDIETSGFNSESDSILSIGWVCIIGGTLDISTSSHYYIKPYRESVNFTNSVIHHIVPDMLVNGIEIDLALFEMFTLAQGKKIVVHGACVEANFFSDYFKRKYHLNKVPIIYLDTILIEKYFCKKYRTIEDFRLSITRKRYQLYDSMSHNALIDSISTAELFLCQVERLKRLNVKSIGELCWISMVM